MTIDFLPDRRLWDAKGGGQLESKIFLSADVWIFRHIYEDKPLTLGQLKQKSGMKPRPDMP